MTSPLITLYDTVGLGLIVPYPTGILFSNQTAGTACMHPTMEGFYFAFNNDIDNANQFLSPEKELYAYFTGSKHQGAGATGGLDEEDVEKINSILKEHYLDEFIKVDLSKLKESHEAWIHVVLHKNSRDYMKNFEFPLNAALTWLNSD